LGVRILVLAQWGWNYFTRNQSARLITHECRVANERRLPTDPRLGPTDGGIGDARSAELPAEPYSSRSA